MRPLSATETIGRFTFNGEIQTGGRPRRSSRLHVEMEAGLRKSGSKRVAVQVTDLSLEGFRVAAHFNLWPGSHVWLSLPGLESRRAVVAWANGDVAGLSFDEPLHPSVLDMIVGRFCAGE